MTSITHDFAGYQVLVIGGTRGDGHAIASAFADAGASVTVTGTMMLRGLYDSDLRRFDYEMVNLARQESMDLLVSAIGDLDVLVLAASCHLPYGLPDAEQAFIAEAARSGVLGPAFLTTRLRLKLSQSPAPGGGSVINTGAVRSWLELSSSPEDAQVELEESTRRAGEKWAGLGIRVNAVTQGSRTILPRQFNPSSAPGSAGGHGHSDMLVRTHQPPLREAVSDAALFLASGASSRITGQTLRLS